MDGTNTHKDPYTCQSESSLHPGIYVNKSLSLIGYGPIPPHIRCCEGSNMTFDGSSNAQQINFTLSGLYLNESSVYFQDSSVTIDSCTFEGSKRGVQFLINTRMVSTVQITNSSFSKNSECISIAVNSSKEQSQILQVIFTLNNSSFYGNAMSDKGSCISFKESPDNNQSVSCNITLENVTFSHNKFSSSGLVFLELENGKQEIHLRDVKFINNNALSGLDAFVDSHSEYNVRSNVVNIFINASNFKTQNARPFNVRASNISLQIYNSSFGGHNVKGNGGVIFLRGTDLCMVSVSNSSFVDTSAAQGGAFSIECMKVKFSLQESIFLRNTATNGSGGAVLINAHRAAVRLLNSYFTNNNASSNTLHGGGALSVASFSQTTKLDGVLLLTVERCSFVACRSGYGGALSVSFDNQLQIVIKDSHFISNYAESGGALNVLSGTSQITIENSTFLSNKAHVGGALFLVGNYKQSHHGIEWSRRCLYRPHLYTTNISVTIIE